MNKNNITFILSFLVLLLFIPISSAESVTSNNFTVTWYDCNYDLTQSTCKVDIQNLANTSRDFNLSVLINSTNYNLNSYTTISTMKEWKAVDTNVPVYETVLINETCYTFDNFTNTSIPYDCSYNQTIQNGTKVMNLNNWKVTKSNMLKESLKQKMYYGTINIPKYDSKAKVDDLNNTETINGTKTFMIEWTTPIIKTDAGWGNSGLIAFIDEISGDVYHPWWNATWGYKKPILINNTGNATILTNYQVKLNVTYDSDMQAEFNDIRVVNDTSGAAVPYWIESKVNSSYANIWFNASSIPASVWTNTTYYLYYGNTVASDASNYDNTFTKDYGESGLAGLWHMDDGTSPTVDSSGNGNNGTVYGATWVGTDGGQWDNRSDVQFATGNTLLFDGVYDYISLIQRPIEDTATVFSISAWVKPISTFGDTTIFSQAVSSYCAHCLLIENGHLLYQEYPPSGGDFLSNASINSNTWSYVVLVRNGNIQTFYINGTLDKSDSSAETYSGASSTNWSIGSVLGTYWFFNGSIDEVRIYNRALSPEEIYRHYIRSKYASPEPNALLGTEEANIPIIISWGNDYTNNNTLSLTVPQNTNVTFNATANQILTTCSWVGATQINCTANTFAYKLFDTAGTKYVNLSGSNANGTTSNSVNWTIQVEAGAPESYASNVSQNILIGQDISISKIVFPINYATNVSQIISLSQSVSVSKIVAPVIYNQNVLQNVSIGNKVDVSKITAPIPEFNNPRQTETSIYPITQYNNILVDVTVANGYINNVSMGITYNGIESIYIMSSSNNVTWSYSFTSGTPGVYSVTHFYAMSNISGINSTTSTLYFTVLTISGSSSSGGTIPTPTPTPTITPVSNITPIIPVITPVIPIISPTTPGFGELPTIDTVIQSFMQFSTDPLEVISNTLSGIDTMFSENEYIGDTYKQVGMNGIIIVIILIPCLFLILNRNDKRYKHSK